VRESGYWNLEGGRLAAGSATPAASREPRISKHCNQSALVPSRSMRTLLADTALAKPVLHPPPGNAKLHITTDICQNQASAAPSAPMPSCTSQLIFVRIKRRQHLQRRQHEAGNMPKSAWQRGRSCCSVIIQVYLEGISRQHLEHRQHAARRRAKAAGRPRKCQLAHLVLSEARQSKVGSTLSVGSTKPSGMPKRLGGVDARPLLPQLYTDSVAGEPREMTVGAPLPADQRGSRSSAGTHHL